VSHLCAKQGWRGRLLVVFNALSVFDTLIPFVSSFQDIRGPRIARLRDTHSKYEQAGGSA
jgi:hypothetical protein